MSKSWLHTGLNLHKSTEFGTAARSLVHMWEELGWRVEGMHGPTSSLCVPPLTFLPCGSAAGLAETGRIQGSRTCSPTLGCCSHNHFLNLTSKACQTLLCSHTKSLNLSQCTLRTGNLCSL